MKLYTIIVLVYCTSHWQTQYKVLAYSTGAPDSACTSFFPTGHAVTAQTEDHSYTITAKDSYTAGETITVTINGATFKGFLIKARRESGSDTSVGTFSSSAAEAQASCTGNFAATHTGNTDKDTIELTYTAPDPAVGNLIFQATVVQERVVFWDNVLSTPMTGTNDAPEYDTSDASPQFGSDPTDINFDLCGSDEGCFRNPSDCTGSDCDAAATWRLSSDSSKVIFKMIGKREDNGWIALGFSLDQSMGADNVYACIHYNSAVAIQNSYNEEQRSQNNRPLQNSSFGILNGHISYENGLIKCSFERAISISAARRKRETDSEKTLALDQNYYLFLGHGPSFSLDAGVSYHVEATPLMSSETVTVTEDIVEIGASSFGLFQAHGVLMLIAWMGLISVSLMIARHYKQAWPGVKVCEKDIWFPLHAVINRVAVTLTVIAFTLIFVAVGSFSSFSSTTDFFYKAHPCIGIIVTALAFINPFMALFRPKPDAENRYIFNYAHKGVGLTAQVLAVSNIFSGVSLPRSKNFVHSYVFYLMITFVVIHLITGVTLEVHNYLTNSVNPLVHGDTKKAEENENRSGESKDETNSKMKTLTTGETTNTDQASGTTGNASSNNKGDVDKSSGDASDRMDSALRFKYIVLTTFVVLNVGLMIPMVIGMLLPK